MSFIQAIALLNMGLKILTKVLHYLVSPYQTGFMPQKATDIELCRGFTHVEICPEGLDDAGFPRSGKSV